MMSRVSHMRKYILITKEHMVMHTNLILMFKWTTIVLFKVKMHTVTLQSDPHLLALLHVCYSLGMPTFKTVCSILLIINSWFSAFYHTINSKYSITINN